MASAATCSRNVTSAVEVRDVADFRTMRPRMPGLSIAIMCSFSRQARLLPVPAGPDSSTSGPRQANSSRALPTGR